LRCDPTPEWQGISRYSAADDSKREEEIQTMEKMMKKQRLPQTDSIEELASFWDAHDLTDFAEEVEEVAEPVFVRSKSASLSIDLKPTEAQHLKRIARSKGVKETTVVRQWILERLHESLQTDRRRKMERQ
jgi:hypothetical protein